MAGVVHKLILQIVMLYVATVSSWFRLNSAMMAIILTTKDVSLTA